VGISQLAPAGCINSADYLKAAPARLFYCHTQQVFLFISTGKLTSMAHTESVERAVAEGEKLKKELVEELYHLDLGNED